MADRVENTSAANAGVGRWDRGARITRGRSVATIGRCSTPILLEAVQSRNSAPTIDHKSICPEAYSQPNGPAETEGWFSQAALPPDKDNINPAPRHPTRSAGSTEHLPIYLFASRSTASSQYGGVFQHDGFRTSCWHYCAEPDISRRSRGLRVPGVDAQAGGLRHPKVHGSTTRCEEKMYRLRNAT